MTTQATSVILPGDTRSRILDLAEDFLLERGFNAFSYQHIARELDMKPAAIHYYYPSKDDLGTAIVARQLRRLRKWRDLPRVADLPPAEQLEALLTVYDSHARHECRVCMFGALAADFRTLPATMQAELRTFNSELTAWLAQVLAAGRATGSLRFVGSPSAKALQVLTTLAGALQVARVHDATPYHSIVGQLRLELLA
ncbi:TetR/AcrR family transcriptional regulator [Hymenobacter sp. BT770]|uniref:TetR/AcrR family transcriptional regulator n=1 Tax=Hymenobacter sp. BT770 TaxID=2886942 RepID=UPI001D0FEBED|nr:TetR/AcrR family transcriptional regulator [Hymenobacter sp. BT770]MCC3152014.1 TetR/AcrR family transcriptional regulator [Hymenobacter sp. BT770]MDO3415303.1 TetR/AcrR family transcriptional regulator [Hymenobacter sp. BT770]